MERYAYAYVIGNLIVGLPLWTWLFVRRKDLRREMLIGGAIIALLALLWEPWFMRDYWIPEPGHPWRRAVGDVLYGFLVGGVACVIYAAVLRTRYAPGLSRRAKRMRLFLPCALLGLFAFQILVTLGVRSIAAASATFLLIAGVMVAIRRDLLTDALFSGALMTGLTFCGYLIFLALFPGIIQAWWKPEGISGLLISGVPVEELIWAFAFGTIAGLSYEFFSGATYRKD